MSYPVVTIIGPTASGKTDLSLKIAQDIGAEIISADSRQIYTDLNIMSGKPSPQEQGDIPHHLIGEIPPWHTFSAAEFKHIAQDRIYHIHTRQRIPLIVGGTGLYITGLIYNYTFGNVCADPLLRSRLDTYSLQELYTTIRALNPHISLSHDDSHNRYRLIRLIEKYTYRAQTSSHSEQQYPTLQIGIWLSKDTLKERIQHRVDARLANGVIEEIQHIYTQIRNHTTDEYAKERIQSFGLGSRLIWQYLHGHLDYYTMRDTFITAEYQYAKRQMTWFKRDPNIHWLSGTEENNYTTASNLIHDFLETQGYIS